MRETTLPAIQNTGASQSANAMNNPLLLRQPNTQQQIVRVTPQAI